MRSVRFLGVLVLACVQFVIVVDESAIALLAPVVGRDFAMGDDIRHVLVTPFAAAFIIALPVTAAVLRRVDPQRILAPATIGFAVCAAAGAAAPTPLALIVARIAQGAAAGITATSVLAALHVLTRGSATRQRDFSVFAVVSGAGAVSALVVAGPLATLSWRWCFVAVAAGAAVLGLVWPAVLRRVESSAPVQSVEAGGPSVRDRVTPLPVPVSLAVVVAANALLAASIITVSFALQDDFGWSAMSAGLAFLPLNGAAACAAFGVSRLSARFGTAPMLLAGTILLAAGCAALAAAHGPAAFVAATILVGFGVGVVFPLVNDRALDGSDGGELRRAAGVGASQQVGLAVGALVAAAHAGSALVALSGCVIVAAVVVAVLRRSMPGRVTADTPETAPEGRIS